ncbi:MAG: hypothetical protein ACOC6J_08335 [Spirochaetota bacterium]
MEIVLAKRTAATIATAIITSAETRMNMISALMGSRTSASSISDMSARVVSYTSTGAKADSTGLPL